MAAMAVAACGGFIGLVGAYWQGARPLSRIVRDERFAIYACTVLLAVPGLGQVRYMTALLLLAPIAICDGIALVRRRYLSGSLALAGLPIAYLSFAHIAILADDADGWSDPCAPVLDFLLEQELDCGYGSYPFQAYAAFLRDGRIKISPQIGPIYIDKIPAFSRAVDRCKNVFYILPDTDVYDRQLEEHGVGYRSATVSIWKVIWDMDQRLYPEDLLPDSELARPEGFSRWSYRANPAVLHPYRGGH